MNKGLLKIMSNIAEQTGLAVDERSESLYGVREGYSVVVRYLAGSYNVLFSVSTGGRMPDPADIKQLRRTSKAITATATNRYKVTVTVKVSAWTTKRTIANVAEAVNTCIDFFRSSGYTNCCETCGATGPTDPYYIGGPLMLLCPDCFRTQSAAADANRQTSAAKKELVIPGIIGALLGSLLGVLAIVLISRLGYVSVLSGLIMGVCTIKGYELLAGKLSVKGIVISIIIMLGMVYVGNNLDWAITAALQWDENVFDCFCLVPALVAEGYIDNGTYIWNLVLVYLFTLIGAIPTAIGLLQYKQNENVTYRLSGSSAYPQDGPAAQSATAYLQDDPATQSAPAYPQDDPATQSAYTYPQDSARDYSDIEP